MDITNKTGRRKTAIARVYVQPGKGTITVNERELTDYFKSEIHQILVKQRCFYQAIKFIPKRQSSLRP